MSASTVSSGATLTSERKDALLARAQAWCSADPDPETAAELSGWIERRDFDALLACVDGELEFGTAGLRAIVGPGPNRMNSAVIRRATKAVADQLKATMADATARPVVLGADARLSSPKLSEDTAGVFAAAGFSVRYFEGPVSTPLVAYAARVLEAPAAVILTASHNPQDYNGYKLYASNAIQIVSPTDEQIAERIRTVGPANAIPIRVGATKRQVPGSEPVSPELIEAYYRDVLALWPRHEACRDLPVVYTPLHGVGAKFTERVFRDAGFSEYHVVPSQAEPDGRFPSLSGGVSPNPEDLRALAQAESLGREIQAELVLAHDPDADRLAVSVPAPKGGFRPLTGNQIGLILADALLAEDQKRGESAPALVVQSIVSSPMLERIAAHYGARSERTLTGFKWVWNAGLELSSKEGLRFLYGYEEALGYSIGPIVRDKDGVSAALVFAEIVAELRAEQKTVFDRLETLYRRDGLWLSLQHSINVSGSNGQARIEAAMARLRQSPPQELSGRAVTSLTDFSVGAEERARWLPAQNLIELSLGTGGRCLARPSGTEPKLKFYVDLRADVAPSEDLWAREAELQAEAEALRDALLRHVELS